MIIDSIIIVVFSINIIYAGIEKNWHSLLGWLAALTGILGFILR